MKYIDTNVLVRVITGDNQTLATQAINEIQRGSLHNQVWDFVRIAPMPLGLYRQLKFVKLLPRF